MEENISAFLDVSKNMSRNASTMNNSSMISESTQSSSIITVVTFLSVVCVLILLGNALVILAFTNGPRRLRTYTNFFVVNLAISDLMVGCLSVPFWICLELGNIDSSCLFLTLFFFHMFVFKLFIIPVHDFRP